MSPFWIGCRRWQHGCKRWYTTQDTHLWAPSVILWLEDRTWQQRKLQSKDTISPCSMHILSFWWHVLQLDLFMASMETPTHMRRVHPCIHILISFYFSPSIYFNSSLLNPLPELSMSSYQFGFSFLWISANSSDLWSQSFVPTWWYGWNYLIRNCYPILMIHHACKSRSTERWS